MEHDFVFVNASFFFPAFRAQFLADTEHGVLAFLATCVEYDKLDVFRFFIHQMMWFYFPSSIGVTPSVVIERSATSIAAGFCFGAC